MKRFHVHVTVENLAQNIRFYSAVFGADPAVVKDDYAKWMLEDPRINFAISTHGERAGIDHLGIQVDSMAELQEMRGRLDAAETPVLEQNGATCCYAKSDKYWATDPQGVAWETYRTLGLIPMFGGDTAKAVQNAEGAAAGCCGPAGCGR